MFFLLSAAPRAHFPTKWRTKKIRWFSEDLQWPTQGTFIRSALLRESALIQRTHEASLLCNGWVQLALSVYRQNSHFSQETPQKLTKPYSSIGEKSTFITIWSERSFGTISISTKLYKNMRCVLCSWPVEIWHHCKQKIFGKEERQIFYY